MSYLIECTEYWACEYVYNKPERFSLLLGYLLMEDTDFGWKWRIYDGQFGTSFDTILRIYLIQNNSLELNIENV